MNLVALRYWVISVPMKRKVNSFNGEEVQWLSQTVMLAGGIGNIRGEQRSKR